MSGLSLIALENFRKSGFQYKTIYTADHTPCKKILLPETISANAAAVLGDGIQEAERHFGHDTTVWIEVADLSATPRYVEEAIEHCAAFGVRIFISDHSGNVSHGSKNVIQGPLLEKIKAAGSGRRWNDIEKKFY